MEPYNPYNFLDAMVDRFREQWETNPAYRARMSGVVGLAAIFGLCSCALIFSLVANSVFASVGFGGGGAGGGPQQQQGGGGAINAIPTFPTDAVPSWTVNGSPAVQVVPNSGTPAPTATVPPTETSVATGTPCFVNCGGHGGGGGNAGTITASGSPNPWVACSNNCDIVIVHTSVPNNGVNIIVKYPNSATGATRLNNGATTTDANGNAQWSFSGPGGCSAAFPNAAILLQAQRGASAQVYWPCQ